MALAVVTTVLTTLVLELLIKPRIERRNAWRRAALTSRDQLSESMLAILAASWRIKETGQLPLNMRPAVGNALNVEHNRWYQQMDDATRFMVDNLHTYALTYIGLGDFRTLLSRYVFTARAVVLSERPRTRKAELLIAMTEPAAGLFFGLRLWNPRSWLRIPQHHQALRTALDAAEEDGGATGT